MVLLTRLHYPAVSLFKPKSHLRDWGARLSTTEDKKLWLIIAVNRVESWARQCSPRMPYVCRTHVMRINTNATYECSMTAVRLHCDYRTTVRESVRTNTNAVGMRYDQYSTHITLAIKILGLKQIFHFYVRKRIWDYWTTFFQQDINIARHELAVIRLAKEMARVRRIFWIKHMVLRRPLFGKYERLFQELMVSVRVCMEDAGSIPGKLNQKL